MIYDNFEQLRDDIIGEKVQETEVIVSSPLYKKLISMQVNDPFNKPNKIWGKAFKVEGA